MSQDSDVDPAFAAGLRADAIRMLQDRVSNELARHCERHDQVIGQAWNKILAEMDSFNKRKRVIFKTLRQVEGEERAQAVLGPASGLEGAQPKSYKDIAHHFLDRQSADITPATTPRLTTPVDGAPPPPQESSRGVNAAAGLIVSTTPTGTGTGTGQKQLTAKRSRKEVSFPTPTRKKAKQPEPNSTNVERNLTDTKRRKIDSWEVEGTDYIFQYPSFGRGYFVIRCDLGGDQVWRCLAHPFKSASSSVLPPAMEHYNNCKTCPGHDATKKYTADDIVLEHGYKVTLDGTDDEDVWVSDANIRLERDNNKNKKARQPEMSPANRGGMSRQSITR